MLKFKEFTNHYEHHDCFTFQGKQYYVHSIVKLTEDGRKFLRSRTNKIILTEQFIRPDSRLCWKYVFHRWSNGLTNAITDKSPDELIESIVMPASMEYSSIQTHGAASPYYKTGKKYAKKDWEIPVVLKGWIIFAVLFVACQVFKETLLKSTILGCYLYIFWPYRQMYIRQNTVYIRDEDKEILREKHAIMYRIGDCEEYKE